MIRKVGQGGRGDAPGSPRPGSGTDWPSDQAADCPIARCAEGVRMVECRGSKKTGGKPRPAPGRNRRFEVTRCLATARSSWGSIVALTVDVYLWPCVRLSGCWRQSVPRPTRRWRPIRWRSCDSGAQHRGLRAANGLPARGGSEPWPASGSFPSRPAMATATSCWCRPPRRCMWTRRRWSNMLGRRRRIAATTRGREPGGGTEAGHHSRPGGDPGDRRGYQLGRSGLPHHERGFSGQGWTSLRERGAAGEPVEPGRGGCLPRLHPVGERAAQTCVWTRSAPPTTGGALLVPSVARLQRGGDRAKD